MKAQNGQVLYSVEPSPVRAKVKSDTQEQLVPLLSTANAEPYEQPTQIDAGSCGQPGSQPSRWRSQWLASTLVLMAFPLLIGGLGLFLFTGVNQELMVALLLAGGIGILLVTGISQNGKSFHN